MRSFAILVDSSCDLPEEYIKSNNIDVLPMTFSLDDTDYPSGYWQDITAKNFYDALKAGKIAKTTQVNPEAFAEIFQKYAELGTDIICIILSGGLSGSYNNSVIAARELKEKYPKLNIFSIDSRNATGGHGLLTMLAVKKGDEGLSAAETAHWLNSKKQSLFALFTVDDLNFLHRGGRLSKFSAVSGSILNVKPLLNVAPDGTLKLKDKARGRKAALETLINQMKRCVIEGAEIDTVFVNHCDCEAQAFKFVNMLKTTFNIKKVVCMMMGPVIGAHTGPGAIAVFFESRMERKEYEAEYYPVK